MRVLQVSVNCSELERSLSFYQKLGFEQVGGVEERQVQTPEAENALLVKKGTSFRSVRLQATRHEHDTLLQLVEWKGASRGETIQTGLGRIVLVSANLDQLTERLRNEGVEFALDPVHLPTHNVRMLWIRDPDGSLVELVEPKQEWVPEVAVIAMPEDVVDQHYQATARASALTAGRDASESRGSQSRTASLKSNVKRYSK